MSEELTTNAELEKVHRKLVAIGEEMKKEAFAQQGRRSAHWKNLRVDQQKLLKEYDAIMHRKNRRRVNVNSVKSKLAEQSRFLANAREKRDPQDTHYRAK